jgi:hypothetical protein
MTILEEGCIGTPEQPAEKLIAIGLKGRTFRCAINAATG